jgi:hypothetical protein
MKHGNKSNNKVEIWPDKKNQNKKVCFEKALTPPVSMQI